MVLSYYGSIRESVPSVWFIHGCIEGERVLNSKISFFCDIIQRDLKIPDGGAEVVCLGLLLRQEVDTEESLLGSLTAHFRNRVKGKERKSNSRFGVCLLSNELGLAYEEKDMISECLKLISSMSEVRGQRWLSEHAHLKTSWIQHQMNRKDGILTYPPPFPLSSSPPFTVSDNFHRDSSPSTSSSGTRISPAVLFIIVILAVLFFISGLLHLLVRFLIKHPSSSASSQSNQYPEVSNSEALQRQLQQLFHLHDSGLDQAFIDALPVFVYKEIVGAKEHFDCAVCLCEFSEKDQLRLLPMCSHAFHINCIDTWLLSNSTCPLCRGTLFNPGFPIENPIYDFDDLREEDGCPGGVENVVSTRRKAVEIEEIAVDKGIFPVRLGKFRKLNGEGGEVGGETSSSNLDARRCYSMGSYQYVVGDARLRVALNHERNGRGMSLLEGRELGNRPSNNGDEEGKKISIGTKTDSYSVSKIWLWPRKGKFASSAETQAEGVSSFDTELPWMRRAEGML